MAAAPSATMKSASRVEIQKLESGLTLLLRPMRDQPVVTVDVWVGTGSAGETPEISGISHFLEHMMFKGTEKFGLGQIEREIENVGGVCNAGTSYDFTHYYITMPSENLARGVEMIAEMMSSSTLDGAELEKERLVILEEYRRKQDNPEAMLYEDLFEQLYETGPYHRSVIGSEETIRGITRAAMQDYYERHYAPANMALLITGDFEPERARELAERSFGGLRREYRPLLAAPEPTRVARAKRWMRAKPTGGEVYYALARAGNGIDRPDLIIPLDLAQYVLGQGRASILFQEVKEKRRLASTISCVYWTQKTSSLFLVDATLEPGRQGELRAALEEIIERFAREPIPDAAFNRARRLIASGHLFSFETTGGASSQTGYYYTLTGAMDFLDGYLERLAAATPAGVQAAFRELLQNSEWVEVAVGPESGSAGNGAAAR